MALFEACVTINSTGVAVFEFLARPVNLPHITPPEAGLRLVRCPERFAQGCRFEFQMTGFGPVQHFLHEIVAFDEPRAFTERQIQGPLRRFVHEHVVEPAGDGNVRVIDRVEFEPPGGLLRFVVSEERILKSLKSALEYRHRELKALMQQPSPAAGHPPSKEQ